MTDSKKDETKRDETLRRMLETPPDPHKKTAKREATKKAAPARRQPK
ncbi:hypothetical protein [Hwanghaeella sp. LZ110]